MKYLAHKDGEREQTVEEHLTGTARLAGKFAEVFGEGDTAYFCGMLHDIGKFSTEFQARINGSKVRVDHSTAGAYEAARCNAIIPAFCIAGHHAGLPDRGFSHSSIEERTLFSRLKRTLPCYSAFKEHVAIPKPPKAHDTSGHEYEEFFLAHMIFSTLVDADRLDTEQFYKNGDVGRGNHSSLLELLCRLENNKLNKFKNPTTDMNIRRCKILDHAKAQAQTDPKLFTMTVPTGGGKTLASMAFALNHAIRNNMQRIIYVIPYTSIIEQTQKVFEEIFGRDDIVAHYCTAEYDAAVLRDGSEDGNVDRRLLATENWDAPIILTTAVQFFESLYSCKPSRCRKLHNIANSVIIFDEAQMLPVEYLFPCVKAIEELIRRYRCSAVLCTATQPSLFRLFQAPIGEATELCPEPENMYEAFRRVTYKYEGTLSDQALADMINEENQALCIVNNRKHAQTIYNMLDKGSTFHLSTAMIPVDRLEKLNIIRQRLIEGKPCRVISTSLIEAGVDVDFPTVFRAMAGLDSIIQAGGRCNREGKRDRNESIVHMFDTDQAPPFGMEKNIDAARAMIKAYSSSDIASIEVIRKYFNRLFYGISDDNNYRQLDANGIMTTIKNKERVYDFASISDKFKLIDDAGYTVYVPKGEQGEKLVAQLIDHNGKKASRQLMRDLGRYAVTVRKNLFDELLRLGVIQLISADSYDAYLTDMDCYSDETGLILEPERGKAYMC